MIRMLCEVRNKLSRAKPARRGWFCIVGSAGVVDAAVQAGSTCAIC